MKDTWRKRLSGPTVTQRMTFHPAAIAWLALATCLVACSEGTRPAEPEPALDAGIDAALDAGSRGSSIADALCASAMAYKTECSPGLYYNYCQQLFQQLDLMDPLAQQAATACFERGCERASLGVCYGEAIAAVEPDWIDAAELESCIGREESCVTATRGDFAACIATSEECASGIAEAACWALSLLTQDRRRPIVECPRSSCEAWLSCLETALRE